MRPTSGLPYVARSAVEVPPLLWLLVLASLVDWLVTRTLTRFAIFMPKTPAMISAYQALGWIGQVGTALAALLACVGLAWIIRTEWHMRGQRWLAVLSAALGVMSLLFLVIPPGNWLLAYDLCLMGVLALLGWRALRRLRFCIKRPRHSIPRCSDRDRRGEAYISFSWERC
jgi:hypothetical protein